MAAAMNGMALHGAWYHMAAFSVFSDYARGAMRLSALMRQQVIYVMTHDLIGLGNGQPINRLNIWPCCGRHLISMYFVLLMQ